jgi:hypothetical protein
MVMEKIHAKDAVVNLARDVVLEEEEGGAL